MVVRRLAAGLAIMGWLLIPPSARAQPETQQQVEARLTARNYARGGYYMGLEGLGALTITGSAPSPSLSENTLYGGGGDMRLGVRHNRWLATEVSGLYLRLLGNGSGQSQVWGMSINERLYLTGARFQPFVTVGLGFLNVPSKGVPSNQPLPIPRGTFGSSYGFAPFFGLGIEMYANEIVAITVTANYHLTVGGISGFDLVTTGIGLAFY